MHYKENGTFCELCYIRVLYTVDSTNQNNTQLWQFQTNPLCKSHAANSCLQRVSLQFIKLNRFVNRSAKSYVAKSWCLHTQRFGLLTERIREMPGTQ